MTRIESVEIQSIGEPACVKIERNSRGYNYEISLHAETLDIASMQALLIRDRLNMALYNEKSSYHEG